MGNQINMQSLAVDALAGSVGGSFAGVFAADVFSALAAMPGAFITAAQAPLLGVALGAVIAVGWVVKGMIARGEHA